MTHVELDQDALDAAVDVIGRTGATGFEVGYIDGLRPDWYAHAQYRGARVTVEHRRDPVEAAEALARRLLNGGMCTHCRGTVTLSGNAAPGRCRWHRNGPKWHRGCEDTAAAGRPGNDNAPTSGEGNGT